MIGKLKNLLGIDGVKMGVDSYFIEGNILTVKVALSSKTDQYVEEIDLKLIETFTRGRFKKKRTNDYILGEKVRILNEMIRADETRYFNFKLAIDQLKSQMDGYAENVLLRPLVALAKLGKGVHSEYSLEVAAKVKGVLLKAEIKEPISLM